MWDSWILTDDELVWSESAPISSPILQRQKIAAKRSSKSSGVKTTSVSSPFAKRSLTSPPCLSHSPFCLGASASTIVCRMPAYSPDCAKSPRHSAPPSVMMSCGVPKYRRHDRWKVDHTTAAVGVPSCCKKGSDLEVRATTDDVQYWQGLTAQVNIKHVQSNDTVELIRAWYRSLPRRLVPRVGVTVRTSISTSDVLEHYGFCVSSVQHFEKTPVSKDVPGFDGTDLPPWFAIP